jgi:hypothetical protein
MLVVSDIHFDPFAGAPVGQRLIDAPPSQWSAILSPLPGQRPSRYGRDTNRALLSSTLAELSRQAPTVDAVLVPGDLITHDFEEKARRAAGARASDAAIRELAAKTAVHVLQELRAAVPQRPIIVSLGNNDSECGDYRIAPFGPFLAQVCGMVRELAGPDRVDADFEQTFTAGGYYGVRHPTADGVDVIVLNDVLWSSDYRDRCGTGAAEVATQMMAWFEARLQRAEAEKRRLWIVHHIPVGIDPFTSIHRRAPSCAARVTPYLKEPYASRFVRALGDHAPAIEAVLAGHSHHDSYRVIRGQGGTVVAEKVVPSVSPIFRNNPGFQILEHHTTGRPVDIETWSLPLTDRRPRWRKEYRFSTAYGRPYSIENVAWLAGALLQQAPAGTIAETFSRTYPVGHGTISRSGFKAHACAIGALDPAAFAACACPP